MKRKKLVLIWMVMTMCLCGAVVPLSSYAREADLPQDVDIEKFVKNRLPEFLTYRTFQKKTDETSTSEVVFHMSITIVVAQHLFLDATEDVIPHLANQRRLAPALEPPMILRKVHGAGEILDIPVEVHFKKIKDQWKPLLLDDRQQFEAMGKPMAGFRFGALVYDTSDAKRAVSDFLKEVKKQTPVQKNSAQKSSISVTTESKESDSSTAVSDISVASEAREIVTRSDTEKFRELEKSFYASSDSSEKKMRQIEASLEKMLAISANDDEIRETVRESISEIVVLSKNYRDSTKTMEFSAATTTLHVQSMCENYAKAFKSLAEGQLTEARLSMRRAVDKRKDIRSAILK